MRAVPWARLAGEFRAKTLLDMHTSLVTGLVHRGQARLATRAWTRYQHLAQSLPRVDRASAVEAPVAAALAQGSRDEALHIVSRYMDVRQEGDAAEPAVSSATMNMFMTQASASGDCLAVLELYDTFTTRFRAEPDTITLTILLNTGRALHHAAAGAHRTRWQGDDAGDAIASLAWASLEGNFAHLHAVLDAPQQQQGGAMRKLAHLFLLGPMDTTTRRDQGAIGPKLFTATLSAPQPLAPGVMPDARFFDALLRFLTSTDRTDSLPRACAWLKALNVEPMPGALATAWQAYARLSSARAARSFEEWISDWQGNDLWMASQAV